MLEKLPPQNIEAEQSILGGLMLEQEAWDEVSDILFEEDFYKPIHRKIFAAIRELNKMGQPTDLITISNYLMDTKELDLVGGPTYLAHLMDQTPSTANIVTYAKIVSDKSLARRLISTCQDIVDKSYDQEFEDIRSFIDQAEAQIFALSDENQSHQGLIDSSELVKSSIKILEELYHKQAEITGVPSGFIELDDMTAGFQKSELVILAARPSMGKTAFSLNVALHAAMSEKKKVAYFSTEMAKEQMMIRLLSLAAKIPLGKLRVGNIDDKAWPRLINKAAELSEASLFIDDTSGISPYEIRAKARRLKAKHGLDMIFVDYLQLMSLKQKVESREREVSEISKALKAIAKELQIPVIALAQLNRGVEGRSDRRPMLSDLRESGSIEQDADIIMMLYREDYYDRDNPDVKGVSEVIVGKQRNGPTGAVKLRWIADYGIFTNFDENRPGPTPPPPTGPHGGPSSKPYDPSQMDPIGTGHNTPKNYAPGI